MRNEGMLGKGIEFCLNNKLIVFLGVLFFLGWGFLVAPFDWDWAGLPRSPVPVDAIPDIGENQQIIFTKWTGRSPQDVEDQITYPLTVWLMGVPGVKTVRSYSMFGFSTIYIIFKEEIDFYWSRSRVFEKLSSLPTNALPEGVKPSLGPDATALGQAFCYTLEGRDSDGNATGGWSLDELRSIQDWYVRYGILTAEGVSEVASVGGFVREYQIDVDPDAMRAFGVSLKEVFSAIKMANVDVGARTIEVNQVEYVIRGLGFLKDLEDIENSVISVRDNVPVYVRNIAHVSYGPALRRGALDKEGSEAVGGVVVVRFGENPLSVIKQIKAKIKEISPGLPKKILTDGTESQVAIIPFYDRSGLIYETLETLRQALFEEILVTAMIVLVMLGHLRSSLLISGTLPLAVLMCFCAMKVFGVDANVVALSGIAIAIGTMVDVGIVLCENILQHLNESEFAENQKAENEFAKSENAKSEFENDEFQNDESEFDDDHNDHNDRRKKDSLSIVLSASKEVGGALITAVATTVVSFLPVFTMDAAEGKLFKPLAWTKTFALLASVFVAMTALPVLAQILFVKKKRNVSPHSYLPFVIIFLGLTLLGCLFLFQSFGAKPSQLWGYLGGLLFVLGAYHLAMRQVSQRLQMMINQFTNIALAVAVGLFLTLHWMPLGMGKSLFANLIFVFILLASVIGLVKWLQWIYPRILAWCLENRLTFLIIPSALVMMGMATWMGLGKEFMPALDEGAYLYMPTTMPHASIGESMDSMRKQDMSLRLIPEVNAVVGKLGRAETPLDPAPISMVETIINYHPEYLSDEKGKLLTFAFDSEMRDLFRNVEGEPLLAADGLPYFVQGKFERNKDGMLIPDRSGKPFRLWRPALDPDLNDGRDAWRGVQSNQDIWDEIVDAAQIPGSTSAPKLQPIAARMVMLQSGMRAPMGIKIRGSSLEMIESIALQIEKFLKEVPSIEADRVIADRIVGKPYLEIEIDREAIARYGIRLGEVQEVIEVGIGGKQITTLIDGRERYPVRVRYLRELRDRIESLGRILVASPDGTQIPLEQIANITYRRGPQSIKSENGFLVGYVLFDMKEGHSEVDVVKEADAYLNSKMASGELELPEGTGIIFAGSYENQVRSEKKLQVILPLSLLLIFVILYLKFKSVADALSIFSGIFVAWAGGFLLIGCYGQEWFLNFHFLGIHLRELFGVHPLNLSVAIWVGFLALFGIASDDGVMMTTYLQQRFFEKAPSTIRAIRLTTIEAGKRRVRPCLMTTATTLLALIPVLTSSGRGSDIMVPMAVPVFGGMLAALIGMFIVPILFSVVREFALQSRFTETEAAAISAATLFVVPLFYCAFKTRITSKDARETS